MRLLLISFLAACAWAAPTIQTATTGAELQTAINNAIAATTGPQIIVLTAGNNFDTATGFTLPARSGAYTGWIVLRSSRVSELPGKTRVSPSDKPKMATLRVTAGGYTPVLYTNGAPSSYWRLEGLEFTLSTTSLNNTGWLIGIGYGTDTAETELSKVSHHFVIDRCYIHGIAFDNGPRDGIRANGANIEILNSYISEIKRDDTETHGIGAFHSATGPLLVRNTFVGGSSIGSLVGGTGEVNASLQPNNVQFLGNYYQGDPTHRALRYAAPPQGAGVPAACATCANATYWDSTSSNFYVHASGDWRLIATGITGNVCIDGDFWENTTGPTYYACTGGVWVSGASNRTYTTVDGFGAPVTLPLAAFASKNRFELKKVTGALVEGNLIENCLSPTTGQQSCSAFLMNWIPPDGVGDTIRNVRIQNNLIRRTGQTFIEGISTDEAIIPPARLAAFSHRFPYDVEFSNNLTQDGNNPGILPALNKLTYYYAPPVLTGLGGTGVTRYSHSRFTHNTLINPLASENFWPYSFVYSEADSTGRYVADNIFEIGSLGGAANWTGGGGCLSFDGHWTNRSLKNNLMVQLGHEINSSAPAYYDTADCRSWAFPWARTGAGVRYAVTAASISGGVLTITFGTTGENGHGLLQGTKIKLAGWSATTGTIDGTYILPRLWCTSGSELTRQNWQQTLCLPTEATGTVTPGSVEASVGYTDYAALNFRLAATSAYKGWATDGSDPGANQDMVEWATATAASGADNPYLGFRVRSIVATAGGAVFRYTAYSTAACNWRASSTRAFSDDLGTWGSETRIGRDGAVTVSGLSNNTGLWYRVTCDAKIRDGEFVTTH